MTAQAILVKEPHGLQSPVGYWAYILTMNDNRPCHILQHSETLPAHIEQHKLVPDITTLNINNVITLLSEMESN